MTLCDEVLGLLNEGSSDEFEFTKSDLKNSDTFRKAFLKVYDNVYSIEAFDAVLAKNKRMDPGRKADERDDWNYYVNSWRTDILNQIDRLKSLNFTQEDMPLLHGKKSIVWKKGPTKVSDIIDQSLRAFTNWLKEINRG